MAILVPYDGSDPAGKAVDYAVTNADGEKLVLLRVVEVASGSLSAGLDVVQDALEAAGDPEPAELSEAVKTLLASGAVDYRTETAVGKPAREIVSFAEDEDEDVSQIVMGSHGRTGVARVLLGSVAESVVRRAPTTVTVVR